MFDIGWSELLVIGVVALVVIGPKELPRVLRTVGQGITKLRRMAGEFQGQFNEALREAELSDLKDNVTSLKNDLAGMASDARTSLANAMPTNPLQDIDDSLKAPTGAVEKGDLAASDAVEAQLPPPGDLEPYPFETIEDEVRNAAALLPGEADKAETAGKVEAKPEAKPAAHIVAAQVVTPPTVAAPVMAASAPATSAPPAAPDGTVAPAAKPKAARARLAAKPAENAEAAVRPAIKRAPRKTTAKVEPELSDAVAALDGDAPASKPVRSAKPRLGVKVDKGPAA